MAAVGDRDGVLCVLAAAAGFLCAEEAGCGELVDFGAGAAVEVQGDAEAFGAGFVAVAEDGCLWWFEIGR